MCICNAISVFKTSLTLRALKTDKNEIKTVKVTVLNACRLTFLCVFSK